MAAVSQVLPRTLLKIQKIAVLTDFSANSDLALHYAAALARGYNASLVLAHAYILPYAAFAAPDAQLVYRAFDDLSKQLSDRLRTTAQSAYLNGLRCKILLREGTPKDLLDELDGVDLIVVGTSANTGFDKAALGSTAEAIFRSSRIPVLTVGPKCHSSGKATIPLNTILYATDFSEGSATALPFAISIASEHNATLVLLHVSEDKEAHFSFERSMASIRPMDKLQELTKYDIERIVADGVDLKYNPTYVVAFGTPETVIVEEAKNRKADLIVIGAQGAGALASVVSHFGGGTAYHVAAFAECPVLTIRKR